MEKIDQLEKELMLPRNNISKKSSKSSGNEDDRYNEFRENINTNIDPNISKKAGGYEHHQLPMKKLNVNNLINQNGSHLHRPMSQS